MLNWRWHFLSNQSQINWRRHFLSNQSQINWRWHFLSNQSQINWRRHFLRKCRLYLSILSIYQNITPGKKQLKHRQYEAPSILNSCLYICLFTPQVNAGNYRVSQKMGLVIVVIVAPKINFKLTPILLDINVPYSRVILSYCGGFCNERFGFYGYFSICRITKMSFKMVE